MAVDLAWEYAARQFDPPAQPEGHKWATPGDLARALDPRRMVQTPALDLIDDELVRLFNTPDGRLIISMPPQEGKSTRAAEIFPVWALTQNPDLRIVVTSYGMALARRNGRAIRNRIITNSDLLGLRLSDDLAAQHEWQLDGHKGGVYAAGVGTALTGRPADLAVIDDPIKDRAEAESETYRQNVWDWWTDVMSTRLAPGAQVCLILTRWHESDLAGLLQAAEDGHLWRVVNIPAQADHDPAKGQTDPLGREPGEYLESARGRTREQWEAIKTRVGSRTWNALYQGRPSPAEGGVFKREWWREYTSPRWIVRNDGTHWAHGPDEVAMSWDMAFKDTDSSDYVVGQVWGRWGIDLYLLDQVCARLSFVETTKALRALAAKWPQAVLKLVEDKANGTAVINALSRTVPGIVPVEPDGSKQARAAAVSPFIEAGQVHLPAPELAPWVGAFIEQCVIGSTVIITRRGLIPASEIQVGDEVLTHRGRFRPVTATSVREAPELVTIQAKTLDPITLTPNHPVYAMSVRRNAGGYHVPIEKDWVPAGEVACRTAVLSARGQVEPSHLPHHAMTIPVVAPEHELREIDLRAWFDTEVPQPKTEGYGRRTYAIVDDGETIRINTARAQPLRYKQELDYPFGRICGLYLAEGSYSTGRAVWSLHKDETDLVEEITSFLRERWGINAHVAHLGKANPNCINVTTSLRRLEKFFDEFGRGAANKRIPWWAWEAPKPFVDGLISGWLDGDGHKTPKGWRGTTVSPHLAWGIRLLATRLRKWPLLRWTEPRKPSLIGQQVVTPRHAQFTVEFADQEKATHVFDGDHIGLWVRETESAGSGTVYNFTVAEDESYVTTAGAVHNCAAFPNGTHDDQVDATTQALNRLLLDPLLAGDELVEDEDLDEEISGYEISPY